MTDSQIIILPGGGKEDPRHHGDPEEWVSEEDRFAALRYGSQPSVAPGRLRHTIPCTVLLADFRQQALSESNDVLAVAHPLWGCREHLRAVKTSPDGSGLQPDIRFTGESHAEP